jgi:hypothetical protein
MSIQMIPLAQLVSSPDNVRKTHTAIGIEELAASIEAHGLLQNLQVRPRKGGSFEVVAGGRRYAALKLLARRKKVAADYLAAFAGDLEMRHAFPRMPEVPHFQLAQLLAPQRVKQQRREDRAVTFALDRVPVRCGQQLARLVIADRRRLAFAAFRLRPLNALDGIVGDGIFLAEIIAVRFTESGLAESRYYITHFDDSLLGRI